MWLHGLVSEGDSSDNSTVVWGEWSAPRVHSLCTLSVRNPDTCIYTWTKRAVIAAWIRHKNGSCALGSSLGSVWGPAPSLPLREGWQAVGTHPPPSLPPSLASSTLLPFHPAGIATSVTPPFFFHCFLLFQELESGTPNVLDVSAVHDIGPSQTLLGVKRQGNSP